MELGRAGAVDYDLLQLQNQTVVALLEVKDFSCILRSENLVWSDSWATQPPTNRLDPRAAAQISIGTEGQHSFAGCWLLAEKECA